MRKKKLRTFQIVELPRQQIKERVLEKIKISQNTGCWDWQAAMCSKKQQYGCLKLAGRSWKVHRLVVWAWYGKDPTNQFVCHRCDRTICCNPEHLYIGTPQDNANDRARRGLGNRKNIKRIKRSRDIEKMPLTKYKYKNVVEVFELRKQGLSQDRIAEITGISQSQISRMLLGQNWTGFVKTHLINGS